MVGFLPAVSRAHGQRGFRLGSPLSLGASCGEGARPGSGHPALPSSAHLSDSHRPLRVPWAFCCPCFQNQPKDAAPGPVSWATFCWFSGSSTCCCLGPGCSPGGALEGLRGQELCPEPPAGLRPPRPLRETQWGRMTADESTCRRPLGRQLAVSPL